MKILVINCGSTSVKYTIYQNGQKTEKIEFSRKKEKFSIKEKDYIENIKADYYAFRIVYGGKFTKPTFLTPEVLQEIKTGIDFAPLHNPKAFEIIEFLKTITDKSKIILTFDTEFHENMPVKAIMYPLDINTISKHRLRKYGYHGLAIESALDNMREKRKAGIPENLIVIQAGGGVSVTAVKNGVSIDTTMGATPVSGIFMLTRSGDIDPEIPLILQKKENMLPGEISDLLNKNSGFYGLTGSYDTKYIIEQAKKEKEPFKTAYELFLYQIKKQIFAFAGVLGAVDLILVSGGLGFKNEFFTDDLYKEIRHLPIRKAQIIKAHVDESKVILKKALYLIERAD